MPGIDLLATGRVLNRFAKDMGSVDEILPKVILDASQVSYHTLLYCFIPFKSIP